MATYTGYSDKKQGIDVLVLPALEDNYIYALVSGGNAAVIDPADANTVLRFLRQRRVKLTHILATHHHHDHVAGIPELKTATRCKVIGPDDPRIPEVDETVGEGATIELTGFTLQVVATPGHSHTHVVFHDAKRRLLWSGDTLFGAGCGRLFDCPPELMWSSLRKLVALPDDTLVFFGHEYTEENLRFAASVEPGRQDIEARQQQVEKLRHVEKPTTPTSIGLEKKTNPFLRVDEESIRRSLNMKSSSALEVFAELRRRKDSF